MWHHIQKGKDKVSRIENVNIPSPLPHLPQGLTFATSYVSAYIIEDPLKCPPYDTSS